MTRFRRHPISMSTWFRDAIVLTYAFPEKTLRALVPGTFQLETRGDLGFVAIALVDMAELRPSNLPPWTGFQAVFVGYRVYVQVELADGRVRRGLKVVRTDVNRLHMLLGTRLLTRYDCGLIAASWNRTATGQTVHVRSRWGGYGIEVHTARDEPSSPPPNSPFSSLADAQSFSGPLPWTFAPLDDGQAVVAVKGVRSTWNPRPLSAHTERVEMLTQPPFSTHEPVLAAAFHVADVAYSWRPGEVRTVRRPGRGT